MLDVFVSTGSRRLKSVSFYVMLIFFSVTISIFAGKDDKAQRGPCSGKCADNSHTIKQKCKRKMRRPEDAYLLYNLSPSALARAKIILTICENVPDEEGITRHFRFRSLGICETEHLFSVPPKFLNTQGRRVSQSSLLLSPLSLDSEIPFLSCLPLLLLPTFDFSEAFDGGR